MEKWQFWKTYQWKWIFFDRASVFMLEFVTPNEFLWFWWKIIVPIPALESSSKNNVHFRNGGLEKIDFAKNGFGAHTGVKSVLAWDFRNSYKLWSPRIAGSTKKSARHGRQDANFDFCNTPWTGTRLQKVIHFQMVFRWFSKVWKFRCIFLHTSSILSVSLFEIAKLALAKHYAHCCLVNSDACRLGGV